MRLAHNFQKHECWIPCMENLCTICCNSPAGGCFTKYVHSNMRGILDLTIIHPLENTPEFRVSGSFSVVKTFVCKCMSSFNGKQRPNSSSVQIMAKCLPQYAISVRVAIVGVTLTTCVTAESLYRGQELQKYLVPLLERL